MTSTHQQTAFTNTNFRLDGKVAIVTGGASGLGFYYTKALLLSGAKVLVVSRKAEAWPTVKEFAQAVDGQVAFLKQDLTADLAPTTIVQTALANFGQIDILVNNAGLQRRHSWIDFPETDWDAIIQINLTAVYRLSQSVAKVMAPQHAGKIINIGSMQSFRAGKFISPYTASKHAIVGLTKAYADALAPDNIQVNALAPGYIDTPMTASLQADPKRNQEILAHIPAQHWGDPTELMGVIVFLASSAANYITGAVIPVDGGYLLR
ncbi:glucose 1-dehydrogenase [Weissella halotolerans]|uniref:2-deoxy-d-gluconate 3-dehydrogenase n=1 Tax=Weissella halotolerans DSM 20190 TaxID=1123500 RepID=A0A0R2G504_9LACO|nr:glucose 1-dehydrogenase [Weissella halotolerans]KRN32348.1 2-deoxy-d-gluconate 3-dehydrogenase [Weissella halotolerans DSM 20190]